MAKRVIVIFPKFERLGLIEQIRSMFDPLATSTEAHITLVFPFESNVSSEQLHSHIKDATRNIQPFQLKLQGITGHEGEYLFLNVKRGNDQIIELHDKLYTGVLAPYLLHSHTYVPHLTVGRLPDNDSFCHALAKIKEFTATFETQIKEISVCSIQADGSDQIDFTVAL